MILGQPGTPVGQRLDTLRSMLKGIYEERVRHEERDRESWIIGFTRDHPIGVLLAFVVGAIVTPLIALVVGIVFGEPIADWWQGASAQQVEEAPPSRVEPAAAP